ncbi:hypothetical protein R83H12_00427 [Fibrobacteria bacterium R8-3-H12]
MPTTITGGHLKLVADIAISNATETLLAAQSFSLGVSAEALPFGSATQVFVAGAAPAAGDFNAETNNYMTDNGGSHAWKPVTLNKHVKNTFKIEQATFEKFTPQSLAALYKPYVEQVAARIIKDAFNEMTSANFSNSLDAGNPVNFDKSDAGKIETALAKIVGAGGTRNLVLNMDFFDSLRDSLSSIYANPTNNEVLRNGTIPSISGFAEVIRTSALPATPASGSYLVGIATNGTGLALATSAVRQVPAFDGESEVAVEPVTKIPLTFSVDYSKDLRNYVATVEAYYGIAVLDGRGILRLTSVVS